MTSETDAILRNDPAVVALFGDILNRYPNHEIERIGGIVRWKPKKITALIRDIFKEENISTHKLWEAYGRGELPVEELAQYYREIGYTLGGFMELFKIPLNLGI